MKWIQARPTVYRGIRMRSRLEADFARWLDSPEAQGTLLFYPEDGATWTYEPQCFASPDGQYLPDFRIDRGGDAEGSFAGRIEYIEVKPLAAATDVTPACPFPTTAPIEEFLARMEIIWESEPEAGLRLVFWAYQAKTPLVSFCVEGWEDRLWKVELPTLPFRMPPLLWAGRQQWYDLTRARGLRIGPDQ